MSNQRVLLIQRREYRDPNLLNEFEALAATAGYEIIGKRDIVGPPSAKFGISSGKVDDLTTWIEINEPDVIFFSPSLKSSQMFRLMETWDTEVRDRTQLILEIFDRHAGTTQAKLQIEHARLKHTLPFERYQIRQRLAKEHTGDRPTTDQVGIGEDLVNLKIRDIRRRIGNIQEKLDRISQAQKLKKSKRLKEGYLEITLTGYTNAGKSTLHSALTGSGVAVADQLFTTLATKAAELSLRGRQVVLSDSVGFISDLPKLLLQAFNTTLMEIADADVIVLVVDASDEPEEMLRKVQTCFDTFTEIGINGIPLVVAMNKIDLLNEEEATVQREILEKELPHVVPISAKEELHLDLLLQEIDQHLPILERYRLSLPYNDSSMSLLSWLHAIGEIQEEEFTESIIRIDVLLSFDAAQRVSRRITEGTLERLPHTIT